MAIKNISLPYVSGFWLFDWWWIGLHHCFGNEIWFGKKIWCCFVIKNRPCNLNSLLPLRWVGFVLFNTNHCHIPWKGKVKYFKLFYVCLNFKSSYCICNWSWILIVTLKMESDLLVDTIRILVFFTRNFSQKNPFWTSIKKNFSIILDKSFWTCPLWPSHVLFN